MVARDLKAAGVTCGLHAFRRYRISECRKARVHEDLLRYWVGHASRGMTDHYSHLAEDLDLRKASVLEAGLGFEVPAWLVNGQGKIAESPAEEVMEPPSV